MPFTTEDGVILQVKSGARAAYEVRLRSGRVLYVEHNQIMPKLDEFLAEGELLTVTYNDQGKVSVAGWKNSRPARVVKVEGSGAKANYLVELSGGEHLRVARDRVTFHPERPLVIGAELELSFTEGKAQSARLVFEALEVSVQRVDRKKGVVSVRGRQGEKYTVRLPADAVSQIGLGESLGMEIHYDEQGRRSITLERPGPAQPTAPTPAPVGSQETRRKANESAALEAEIVGIDALYLAERRREGHRAEIMSFLEEHSRDGLVEWYRMRNAVPPRYAQPKRPLPPQMEQALRTAAPGFEGFYLHQALALDAIRAGKHLVIVTQTASGKTMSYNPAIFERLLQEPDAHGLYVFPLNALMTDQKEKIDQLCSLVRGQGARITAEMLRGGMGAERQAMAQRSPNLLATNPEMLGVVLNEPRRWASFFRTLRYIVIDEVHSYRGIFGVHMSGLVRRLLLTAQQFGANPQLILCSATVSNPLDLAVRLTSLPEEDFVLLAEAEDGSRQDYKHWMVLNPDWGSQTSRFDNYLEVAAAAFVELVNGQRGGGRTSQPLNTILFARSIRDVNRLHRLVASNLRDRFGGFGAELLTRIRSYVSAELSVQDKREIYEGLRSGRMTGVISTNALEAGIDIGRLDACIIAGFPFSVMRMRQMAGRVGRQQEGMVLFVPFSTSALDGYYRDHPDLLLSQPPEVFVVDPHNPYVARKHINAAAYALGGLSPEALLASWGQPVVPIVQQAVRDGVMRRAGASGRDATSGPGNGQAGARYYGSRRSFSNQEDVYAVHSIRSNIQKPYAVCLDDDQPCQMSAECFSQQRRSCPRQVTVLDQVYAYRDCHPGAVYELVSGRLYQVTRFDDAQRVVRVRELPEDSLERTSVEEEVQVELSGASRATKRLREGVELAWGEVVVTRSFTGYRKRVLVPAQRCRRCRKEYGEGISTCPSCGRPTEAYTTYGRAEHCEFPAEHLKGFQIVLKTVACWLSVDARMEQELEGSSPCKLPGASNRVQTWLKRKYAPPGGRLNEAEQELVKAYHQASEELRGLKDTGQESVLFPGTYEQCLLGRLRGPLGESRALEVFQACSGYPVTDELRHVCRKCHSSTLMEALHTLEHVVLLRYPSVALGDQSDLGAFSTLGHAGVGRPAVFWFDDYEGGLGAAEKIYEKFDDLLAAGAQAVQDCSCTTLEGCPRCTHIGGCVIGNDTLSKAALLELINRLTGKSYGLGARPFVYRRKRAAEFNQAYNKNEFAREAHGVGEEAVAQSARPDAYQIMRLQREVHEIVARKAFEIRSQEIAQEVPPVSATELTNAYQVIMRNKLLGEWSLNQRMAPYRVLEVQPDASLKMIQKVYRTIALQVHPDANPERPAWANEMMKHVNAAYDAVLADKKKFS